MTLRLTDGGTGDLDGIENSRIVDPGGIAFPMDEPAADAIAVPVNNRWVLFVLALLTIGLAAPRLRRQVGKMD